MRTFVALAATRPHREENYLSGHSHTQPPQVIKLSDRYEAVSGRVQLTGIQALARLPIEQHRRDLSAGLNVGTLISGYEGSPLAGYDLELARQRGILDANDVVFVPGLNEEAAATVVQGSQLVNTFDQATRDGVLGVWYGKAPGLDRATDALRHGNLMGAHPSGGALVLVGDDPGAKSSSVPCASELALMDLQMPFVYPSDAQEILDLGAHAIALSRASGLWVGMKIVTGVADGSSTVELSAEEFIPELPRGSGRHQPNARLLQPTLGVIERDLVTTRLRLAEEYSRLNRLNQVVGRGARDSIGIVAAGRTYRETVAALERLGIGPDNQEESKVRLLKVSMPWPLESQAVRQFAEGLDEIVVVEEKRSFLEAAIRDILYGQPHPPRVVGKSDPAGKELMPAYGELDSDVILAKLRGRLTAHSVAVSEVADPTRPAGRTQLQLAPIPRRGPYFCSGCPHNSSTKPHGDDLVGAGIGCHALVLMMDEEQVGTVTGFAQMGGEGLQWVGMAPFTDRSHFTQNLGDGTFDHSGSLAIRAAVAAGVNITYRLLYNSAVAMTGGQSAVGGMGVRQIVDVLRAEGVSKIIITTEDRRRYKGLALPADVPVWDRRRLDEAHRVLAEIPGTTVLIHDQECATEKRRKRKRGKLATPATSVFINERLCEGCGDCGRKSNCLSVQPVQTEYGRKTRIHQASCNVDYSCLEGDCPAFMTITGASTRPHDRGTPVLESTDLVDPLPRVPSERFGVRLTGVGGTGVVTASQVLAVAGLIAGWSTRTLDQTGLAQKGGAVVSDLLFDRHGRGHSNKLADGECDLYLGCDLLVAADPTNLKTASPEKTIGVLNTAELATGRMVADVRQEFPAGFDTADRVGACVRPDPAMLDARALSVGLFGDDQFSNLLLVGVGFQLGALPLPVTAVETAIRLNGVAVDRNLQAFRYGRLWVLDPARVTRAAANAFDGTGSGGGPNIRGLQALVSHRAAELVAYQDYAYAERFRRAVERVRLAEAGLALGTTELAETVAQNLFKLMAYKDEYEVARLALDPQVERAMRAQFGPGARARWNLHPPALRAMGMQRKLQLGSWFRPAFVALYSMRRLRGTRFDPFGRAHVRKVERALVSEYLSLLESVAANLTTENHAVAVEMSALPDLVRGYEAVKLNNVEVYRGRLTQLQERFAAAGTTTSSSASYGEGGD